jgi:hypothetical protein
MLMQMIELPKMQTYPLKIVIQVENIFNLKIQTVASVFIVCVISNPLQ